MDKHAPIVKKTILTRPRVLWFNDTIKAAKRERCKYERIWRTTGLESDRLAFTKARNHVNHVIEEARRDYYTDFINKNSTDQRRLFNAVNSLVSERNEKALPPYTCATSLANDFGEFFYRKIVNIRVGVGTSLGLTRMTVHLPHSMGRPSRSSITFCWLLCKNLSKVRPQSHMQAIRCPLVLSSSAWMNYHLLSRLSSTSLESGEFPEEWKGALVKPMIKKPKLELIKNFRPVSNLQFLSKLTEKAVAQQAVSHVITHGLLPVLQSAYRPLHSTETALLRVRNDILLNMNKQQVTLLVFLDLSAAFNTIDHSVLLRRLETQFSFTGTALEWFKSYLSGRFQQVVIDDAISDKFNMDFGVPQGSCLGPLLFSIYTTPLFDIVSNHLPKVHCYADDTQLYLAFQPDDTAAQESAVASMEACIQDIRNWMTKDSLKINDNKTEVILIGTKAQLKKVKIDNLAVGDSKIVPSTEAIRNLHRLLV